MEPNRNNNVSDSSTSGSDDVVFSNKPKPSKGMIVALVCAIALAVGGIGFGVWAMMDGSIQKEQLNSQISTLTAQSNELREQLDETIEKDEDTVFWPATLVHSDNKIYMINDSDKVVAVLEVPMVIQGIIGCSAAVTEDGADNNLVCAGVSNTGQEFGFSYNTDDGTLELAVDK